MDVIDPILSIASEIYSLVKKVKANEERCHRVSKRLQALEGLVKSVQQRETVQKDAVVEKALREFLITLESAKELIRKYTKANWVKQVLRSGSHEDRFSSVNERFDDAFQILSGALQVEQGNEVYKVFALTTRMAEDAVDGKADDRKLIKSLLSYMKDQEEKTEAMNNNLKEVQSDVRKVVDICSHSPHLNKPRMSRDSIRIIKPKEFECDKKPFMTTETSEVYKGKFNGFTVAIKRFLDPKNTKPGEVEDIFNKEVDTMKQFESPNILRMFGICIQNEKNFLIIMEYCEKGSLRQVLDSECLSWPMKARMCLDAAQGLYRLHYTEEKSKVHGCINSSKFLVAEGYKVKLAGFELAKTETSLRKKPSQDGAARSLCYSSPLMLEDVNNVYSTQCEIYSFGIVLWEIATQKIPLKGLSYEEIYQKVYKEKYQEALPEDCPTLLAELITDCRAYDGFQRPSAGALMDNLRKVVNQLEEQ